MPRNQLRRDVVCQCGGTMRKLITLSVVLALALPACGGSADGSTLIGYVPPSTKHVGSTSARTTGNVINLRMVPPH